MRQINIRQEGKKRRSFYSWTPFVTSQKQYFRADYDLTLHMTSSNQNGKTLFYINEDILCVLTIWQGPSLQTIKFCFQEAAILFYSLRSKGTRKNEAWKDNGVKTYLLNEIQNPKGTPHEAPLTNAHQREYCCHPQGHFPKLFLRKIAYGHSHCCLPVQSHK